MELGVWGAGYQTEHQWLARPRSILGMALDHLNGLIAKTRQDGFEWIGEIPPALENSPWIGVHPSDETVDIVGRRKHRFVTTDIEIRRDIGGCANADVVIESRSTGPPGRGFS